jgi:hypothetical protein
MSEYRYSTWYKNRTEEPDTKFMSWMDEVEDLVFAQTGSYLLDLADEPFYEMYICGERASIVADQILATNFTV